MDQSIKALSGIGMFRLRILLHSICVGIVALLCYLNLPSLKAVDMRVTDWSEQSVVGPLARTLRKIDPEKTWRIGLKQQTRPCGRSIDYYKKFGYRLEYSMDGEPKEYDLYILPIVTTTQPVIYFQKRRFIDYHCMIIANFDSFTDTPVFVDISPSFPGNRYEKSKRYNPKNR